MGIMNPSFVLQQRQKDSLYTFAGSIRQNDVFLSGRYAIPLADEIGDRLADKRDSRALRVGTRAMRMLREDRLHALHHILWIPL